MENSASPERAAHDQGKCPICFIGEIGPYYGFNRGSPNLGPRVSVLDHKGTVLARLGHGRRRRGRGSSCRRTGSRWTPAATSMSAKCRTAWPSLFPGEPVPKPLRSLQKLVKVA